MLNYLEKKCHFYLLFLVILIGNGCAYFDIEELKSTPKSNNDFAQALSESYLEFALYEMNEMHDEMDASYFAKKGINARKNIDISPELINNSLTIKPWALNWAIGYFYYVIVFLVW